MTVLMTLVLCSAAAYADEGGPDPELPRSLAEYYPQDPEREGGRFSLGGMAGYVRVRDADEGTWHGGVVARYQLIPWLAAEASISFHSERFADGDVRVTTYPLQVTALVYPFPSLPLRPYALAGGGWYYTRVDFDDSLGIDDDTDRQFAVHVGAGGEIDLGKKVTAFADFRWLFLDEPGVDNSNIRDEEFDTWMVTIGALLRF
jgi:opacity protein-like surface antigen